LPICEETSNRALDDANRKAVNVLQPRVDASATLGPEWFCSPTATRLRGLGLEEETTQPLCGWINIFVSDPRVPAAVTLGWRTEPLCG